MATLRNMRLFFLIFLILFSKVTFLLNVSPITTYVYFRKICACHLLQNS